MNNIWKSILSSLFFVLIILMQLAHPTLASAQGGPQRWTGVCVGDEIEGGEDVATIQGVQCIIANLFSVAITGIGFSGFVMMIWGAFGYIVSGGQSKGVEAGKNTITWAIIGLILALSSVFILRILAAFTGVDIILNFAIPSDSTNVPVQ